MKKSVIVSNVALLQDHAKLHATSGAAGAATGLGPRPARGRGLGRSRLGIERGAVRIATDGECGTNVFLFVVVA